MATVFTFRRTERIEQGIRLEPLPQHDPLEEETARSVGTVSNDLLMLAASLHDTLTAADAIASAADLLVQSADDLETIPSVASIPIAGPTKATDLQPSDRLVDKATGDPTATLTDRLSDLVFSDSCEATAVNRETSAVNPVTSAVNPVTSAVNPVKSAVNPVKSAGNSVTSAMNPVTSAVNPVTESPEELKADSSVVTTKETAGLEDAAEVASRSEEVGVVESAEERAKKRLHSRKFREYCDQDLSKDLGMAVMAEFHFVYDTDRYRPFHNLPRILPAPKLL